MAEKEDLWAVEKLNQARNKIKKEIKKVIIGQDRVIDELLIALLSNGHCLLIGVPGLAKTLMISTIAGILNLKFQRIQFTPDLMPSDITGTEIIQDNVSTGERTFKFVKGPVFANIVLADEINRTPPKTQSALLQAMQEHEVTAGGETYKLTEPFYVLATQNPIELEGTYPLPEAQLDRFMFNIYVDYPSEDEENLIVKSTTSAYIWDLEKVMGAEEIIRLQQLARRVPASDHVINYAVRLARSTRPNENNSLSYIKNWVNWGAGPRASQYMILGAKTKAILDGRYTPSCEDVRLVAKPVLRHRIVTSFNAEADGVGTLEIIEKLLQDVKEE
ncbi:MAG: MoxR family ATPase [candidate division Zixibacteria bacterium]|nr:MoxR family ATPase [candidate division Zixibacteria bacterium]